MEGEAKQTGEALSAWEDINPPMASARPQGRLLTSSDQGEARKVFRNELTACLALTAPAGMTEERLVGIAHPTHTQSNQLVKLSTGSRSVR